MQYLGIPVTLLILSDSERVKMFDSLEWEEFPPPPASDRTNIFFPVFSRKFIFVFAKIGRLQKTLLFEIFLLLELLRKYYRCRPNPSPGLLRHGLYSYSFIGLILFHSVARVFLEM